MTVLESGRRLLLVTGKVGRPVPGDVFRVMKNLSILICWT